MSSALSEEGLLETALDGAGVGYCLIDDARRIVRVNSRFERLLGIDAASLAGVAHAEMIANLVVPRLAHPQVFMHQLNEAVASGAAVEPIDLCVAADGSRGERWLEFRSRIVDGFRLETYADVTRRELHHRRTAHRLRGIFDVANPGMMLLDRDGRIVDINRLGVENSFESFGSAPGIGIRPADFAQPEVREQIERNFQRCLGGESFTDQMEIRPHGAPDSEWFEIQHDPIRDEDGEVELVCLRTISIEGQKEAENALASSEALIRQIVDLVPHMILARDLKGRVLLANRAATQMLDVTLSELLDGEENGPAELSQAELAALESGQPQIREESLTDPEGRRRSLQTTRIAFTSSATREPAVLGISIDVTELRRAERQRSCYAQELESEVAARTADLQRVNRELRELQARLFRAQRLSAAEELAGAVAHSINNPLAALLGTVQLELEASNVRDATLERVHELGKRIERVVDGTLKLFRRGALELRLVDPAEILATVRSDMVARRPELAGKLMLKSGSNLPQILIDRELLLAALTALAQNGVDAMRADGDLTLEVDSLESLSIVRFQVSDRGPGIPPEMRAKVVEPFFTTKGGGTGLGLAIAEGIVQGHRGRLEISDRPGGGAVVSIDLPAA